MFATVCRDVRGLRRVPRGMWVIFVLKSMESFAYFSMGINMVIYFTEEHGLSDAEAGMLYGVYGVLISVYGLLGGFLIDRLGVRRSLVLGSAVSAAGRLTFALCRSRGLLLLATTVLMPAGMALGIPVLTIAVKRYSCAANRTFLFGVFYTVMNVAALAAGPITDAANAAFAEGLDAGGWLSPGGRRLSGVRVVFVLGAATTACMVLVAGCCLQEGAAVDDFFMRFRSLKVYQASG